MCRSLSLRGRDSGRSNLSPNKVAFFNRPYSLSQTFHRKYPEILVSTPGFPRLIYSLLHIGLLLPGQLSRRTGL